MLQDTAAPAVRYDVSIASAWVCQFDSAQTLHEGPFAVLVSVTVVTMLPFITDNEVPLPSQTASDMTSLTALLAEAVYAAEIRSACTNTTASCDADKAKSGLIWKPHLSCSDDSHPMLLSTMS